MMRRILDRTRCDGFSLVELMIVLAFACVMAAIAVPGLAAMYNNYSTIFAAQEVTSQLHFAKMRAVSSNEPLRVSFAADGYRVQLADGTTLRGPLGLPTGMSLNTSDGGDAVTFPGGFVTFQPNGTIPVSGNGSAGRVRLISRNNLRIDIIVESGGGIRHTPAYKTSTPPY